MKMSRTSLMASLAVCALGAALIAAPNDAPTVRTDMPVLRATTINGMAVKNQSGEDLGKVEDVVIDMGTGKVRYAAVSFGGFLGVGDKLFAVPFHAFKVAHDANSRKTHLVLNVDKATLEKAKGFDKNTWPDFANPRFGEENDRIYGAPPRGL